jgi:GntR family transcriptional regulator
VYYCSNTVNSRHATPRHATPLQLHAVFQFDLLPSSATPIYRQIVDQVLRAVASGTLAAGDELPSVRAVALQQVVNPMTVSKAYSLLETQGIVERKRGVGMIIRESLAASLPERLAQLRPALEHAASVSRQLGISPDAAIATFQQILAPTDQEPPPHE